MTGRDDASICVDFSPRGQLCSCASGSSAGRGREKGQEGGGEGAARATACVRDLNAACSSPACLQGAGLQAASRSPSNSHPVSGRKVNGSPVRAICFAFHSKPRGRARPHVANVPAPFHAPLPLLCSIKQQHHAKPDRALLHRVAVLSDLFATCLACHCFAASRRGCPRQGLHGPRVSAGGAEGMAGGRGKGIRLSVFGAMWANGYPPRRKDLLRSGK